jgi:hypothetical protein
MRQNETHVGGLLLPMLGLWLAVTLYRRDAQNVMLERSRGGTAPIGGCVQILVRLAEASSRGFGSTVRLISKSSEGISVSERRSGFASDTNFLVASLGDSAFNVDA